MDYDQLKMADDNLLEMIRDYIAFYDGEVKHDRTDQQILNEAYAIYCHHKGKLMLKACLDQIAPLYGRSSRQVFEAYDTDRTLYPTGYSH